MNKKEAIRIAEELANRFSLPPDQSLLVTIIGLGNKRLTHLALEELLELDDRGRVRRTEPLLKALKGVKHREAEIRELRDLILEKLQVRRAGQG